MTKDWERRFIPAYRLRGLQYYREGRVISLTSAGDGRYTAVVRGGDNYLVTVEKGGMTCSCSLGRSGYRCKHMAAVMYAISAEEDAGGIASGDRDGRLSGERVPLFPPEDAPAPAEDSYLRAVPYYDLRSSLAGVTVPREYSELADVLIRSGDARLQGMTQSEYFERTLRCQVNFKSRGAAFPFAVYLEARRGREPDLTCQSRMRKYPCGSAQEPLEGKLCPHCVAALRLAARKLADPAFPAMFSDSSARRMLDWFSRTARSGAAPRARNAAPITVSPILDVAAFRTPAVLFKVGGGKKLQCKDLYAFADAFHAGGTVSLSDREALDFSLQGVDEASRPMLEFLVKWTDNDRALSSVNPALSLTRSDRMLLPLYGERLDEFFDLCAGTSLPVRGSGKETLLLTERPVLPAVTLTPVYENGFLCGVRVEGGRPAYLIGSRYAYCLDTDKRELARMDLQPVREWEKRLPSLTGSFSVSVGREALPDFYRHVVPFLREHAAVTEVNGDPVAAWLPPEGEIAYYIDADGDRITCAVSAVYGDREWRVFPGGDEPEPWRDRVMENGALDAAREMFPETDEKDSLLCRPRDDGFICFLLTEGIASLEKWGRVMASERFSAIRVRRRFKVQAGVKLENDLLTLNVTCGDLSEKELAEILEACVMKKRWHRLKSGDYVDLESESVEDLRRLMEAADVPVRDFVKGKMRLPAYRALYLEETLRDRADVQSVRDAAFRQLIRAFRTVSESDFEVPASLAGVLRPYQTAGFQWLMTLASAGFGGILADDMGLGKTLQMICALKYRKDHTPEKDRLPSLVVCPASLVYNWQSEIRRFSPDLKALPVTGSAAQRKSLIASARDHDVLITSYDLLKRDTDLYADLEFDFHVLDEAQYVKTASSVAAKAVKTVRSAHRFALTGTPIENSLSELWSIFDFLMPGFLYDYGAFRSRIEIPAVKDASSDAMQRLKKMTAPFIMRRLKKDVLRDLPDKLEETRTVVLSPRQGQLYSAQVTRLRNLIENTDEESFGRSRFRVLAEITRLRQICCDPSLFAEGYEGESCKREALSDLLAEAAAGGHKALVFSQFTSMLDLIATDLKSAGTPFYMLTGATPKEERVRMANAFNRDGVGVFLISLKAGGTGLNLTGADIVVHYDPWWNAAATSQATDRAHRIGQDKTVTVFKLICRDTIEEKILRLQEKKHDLAEEILSGESGTFSRLTREELMDLITPDGE